MTERFVWWLIRWRNWLAAVAVIVTLLAIVPATRLQFDEQIESLYAGDNPYLLAFQQSREDFGGDEFVILALSMDDLLTPQGRLTPAAGDKLRALSVQLQEVPGIDRTSVNTLAEALRIPFARERLREFVNGMLVSADGTATTIVARLAPLDKAPVSRAETFLQVRAIAQAQTPPAVVVGEPVQVHDMFRYVQEDGTTLGLASSGLLILVMLVLFRSLRWTLLPVVIVQVALLWTKALLVLSGTQLSMVSSMLNSLVTIIGISTTMHLTLSYREKAQHLPRDAALAASMTELMAPIFWAILTTAAGFLSLMTSNILPVSSFGLMMTIATLMVLLVYLMIMPAMVLAGRSTPTPAILPAEHLVARVLTGMTQFVLQRPVTVSLVLGILSLGCCLGLIGLQVETDFSKNFRSNSPIVKALTFFEERLGGAGTWEVGFTLPGELDTETLEQVRELSAELRQLEQRTDGPRLTKVISLTDGLDLVPERLLFRKVSLETRLNLMTALQTDFVSSLYNAKTGRMRILLRAIERQPADQKLRLISDVEQIARKYDPAARATGLFVLLAFLIESLLGDQLTSSMTSAAILVVLMWVAYRRVGLAFGLLLPNLFPIAIVIGSLGLAGVPVNIGTAMIACVSLGLTIDSSVHWLAVYLAARQRGDTHEQALQVTLAGTGLTLVFSNVALVLGFSVLALSQFLPLVYFGLLVSVALIGGLIGNLLLMPLLVRGLHFDLPTNAPPQKT